MAEFNLERALQLAALIAQGVQELQNMLDNKEEQKLRTEDENFDHAEMRNKKARELIDAL